MLVFESLLRVGATVAAMSDETDGDCSAAGVDTGERASYLERVGAPPEKLCTLQQVHGNHVADLRGSQIAFSANITKGDGLVTAEPMLPIAVTVADCVPILLFDPVTRTVAAIHAGREGTVAGIGARGLQLMMEKHGVNPADVHGVIGPSAGPCCYEVSPELVERCTAQGVIAHGRNLDLWSTNRNQLLLQGMENAHIEISGHCTICMAGFYSFRRQETRRRSLAVIMA